MYFFPLYSLLSMSFPLSQSGLSKKKFATTLTCPGFFWGGGGFHWVWRPGTSVDSVENLSHLAFFQPERERVAPQLVRVKLDSRWTRPVT